MKDNKEKLKRWNLTDMLDIGRRLFKKIHKRKHSTSHNHEIHFLAREIDGLVATWYQDDNGWQLLTAAPKAMLFF